MKRKAIFLDRDGVINKDIGYVYKTEDLHLLDNVAKAFIEIKKHNKLIIVVTNQSGIARGMYSMNDTNNFHLEINKKLLALGAQIPDKYYIAPYHKDGIVKEFSIEHPDRKPDIGMLIKAQQEFNIDLGESYLVGDKVSDIKTSVKANLKGAVQIISNASAQRHPKALAYCDSLYSALAHIL